MRELINFIVKTAFISTIIFLGTNAAYAASLAGAITDSATGKPLVKATVALTGTKKGIFTDAKGEYIIKDLPAGEYEIEIRYVGYETKKISKYIPAGDERTQLNVALNDAVKKTGIILVEAAREKDNEASMLSLRKNASQVGDGISMEEIKRFPDANAGQSLRRIAGVTLVSNKFVYVRGVGERYNATTLNGASLATTEPDKKAFSFDIFPSEFLENANVAKSFTPDLPGNFAGGLVQLNTVDFPKTSGFKLSLGTAFTEGLTFNHKFVTYDGGRPWNGFAGPDRELPKSVPATPDEFRKLTAAMKSSDEPTILAANNRWLQLGKSFSNKGWKRDTAAASPAASFSLSYANALKIGSSDFGIIASASYGNSYSFNSIARGTLLTDGSAYSYYGEGAQSTYSTNLGGIVNLSYRVNEDNTFTFKNTYNNSSDDETTEIDGYKDANQIKQYGYRFVQKTLLASQLGGVHRFGEAALDWTAAYSNSYRDEPDFRRARYSRNDSTQPFRIDIQNFEGAGHLAGRFFSALNENAYSSAVNYSIPLGEETKIKFGGSYELKSREFKARSFTITQSPYLMKYYYDSTYGMVMPLEEGDNDFYNNAFTQEPERIFEDGNFSYNKLGYSEETKPSDSYKAQEDLTAAYAMLDAPVTLFDRKLRIIGGLRAENSVQKLKSYYGITASGRDSTFTDRSYLDFLPAINLIYEITKNQNIRGSASQTLTRPTLREYAPFTFYDFEFQGDVTGNPDLERALILNYDLRWEYYPNPGEAVSIGLFYKRFEHAIEETIIPTSSNFKRTFDNATGPAYNYGVEIEVRKSLSFLGDIFKPFSVNFNCSLIQSEIEVKQVNISDKRAMQGQSPYTINAALFYYNPEAGASVSVSYNTFGKRIAQVADITRFAFKNPHIYELPRNTVDISIAKTFFGAFEAKFVAKDILNEEFRWEQGGKKVYSNARGRGYSFSIGYKWQ